MLGIHMHLRKLTKMEALNKEKPKMQGNGSIKPKMQESGSMRPKVTKLRMPNLYIQLTYLKAQSQGQDLRDYNKHLIFTYNKGLI